MITVQSEERSVTETVYVLSCSHCGAVRESRYKPVGVEGCGSCEERCSTCPGWFPKGTLRRVKITAIDLILDRLCAACAAQHTVELLDQLIGGAEDAFSSSVRRSVIDFLRVRGLL